jgi:leucyl-tRNA---protein transferase
MFEEFIYPDSHKPAMIDDLLALGWFRMGQSIFTTNYVLFDQKVYRTIWLRLCLKNHERTSTYHKLVKRNKHFRVELKKILIDKNHELLFELYREAMPFQTSTSLHDLMYCFGMKTEDVFNTYEINVYDGNNLIACSYFDVGKKSAEGISAYYNPDYKNYSLGKYLIYLQIEICIANRLDYFYPGYFVPQYPHLDYKLSIGSNYLDYFDTENNIWHPIRDYEQQGIPIEMQLIFR